MPETRRTRLGSYGVAIADSRILLCRIAPSFPEEGHWTLPGGGIDWGEHPDDALIREVREETGLELESFTLAGVDSVTLEEAAGRPQMHAVRFIYRCVASGEPNVLEQNGSVDTAAWIRLGNLSTLPIAPIVDRALQIATNDDHMSDD